MTLSTPLPRGTRIMVDGGARGAVAGGVTCGARFSLYLVNLDRGGATWMPAFRVWPVDPPAAEPPVRLVRAGRC